jgi:hypothetical protein
MNFSFRFERFSQNQRTMDVRFYKEIKNSITTSSRLLKDSKEMVVFLKEPAKN